MAADEDYIQLRDNNGDDEKRINRRIASIDVFRGLSVSLMIFVDYAGSLLPFIGHSPWNGVHLADCVMPFFLLIVGLSLAISYKKVDDKVHATRKAVTRAIQLFLLGVFLQGGYFHGITSLTFGVDIESIRWLGILQKRRWSISLCFCLLCRCTALALCIIYSGLLYGVYVSDWQFEVPDPTSSMSSPSYTSVVYTVKCGVRGDLGPACNSAGLIDRYVLGLNHLYKKPVYKNLKECSSPEDGLYTESQPPWCQAPFDPEGILSSLTAAVTCIIGLHYGHVLVQFEDHKSRLLHWSLFSVLLFVLGVVLTYAGIPLNKSLYTVNYMLLTSAISGATFCALYVLVDVYGCRRLTFVLEWMGVHSLAVFVLVTSNLAVILIQGFYWKSPKNNIIIWIITRVVRK
ncbi:heparan-alpha-glucosaminide N-acetyltransferase [Ranunculus cassubicifolius]